MIKNSVILKVCMLLLSTELFAQSEEKIGIAIETDPVTTVFGAKTISVIIEPKKIEHWSLFLNVVSADFPNWMDDFLNPQNKGENFDAKITLGGGFALDYFLKSEQKGYYIGLVQLFFNNHVRSENETKELWSHNIIPRIGYRWYPFEKVNFYVNPFLGLRYEYLFQEQTFNNGKEFKGAGIGPFGTIHIGYHF